MSYTYTQLKDAIQNYTDNNETTFVANLDRFIKNAEQRIFTTVDLEFFRKNASGAMTSGNQFLATPTDYLASFSLSITNSGSKSFLLQKDMNYLAESYPDSTVTGVPKYYAHYDVSNFLIAPTPNDSYTVEIAYYHRPASLSASRFNITVNNVVGTFVLGDVITGATSGQSSSISTLVSATEFTIGIPTGTFTVGETVTGSVSGATGIVASTSADTTTTWLSENATNALLYACLVEAYTYMKGEPDLLQLYNGRFGEALGRIKDLAEARENTDAYRKGLPSQART
jgi:hypothetical protein|tara:strand:- start:886 stop:1740 length:855 start_codon:yes stop_codon:yes gene_type:complete